MHIKQVIISGFRSFQFQGGIEPLSDKHNVIVGRNGCGKSNFFDAIQYVLLGSKFSLLRQEDRLQLLHEGAGASVVAAYVEIIFDNSDGRLPVDTDEVVLRRTTGQKKDQFFLNRKPVQKSEVQSVLERAGFSKSNPYYFVQQGKVATLCVMKDSDRLNLLKEIAGTNVYEDRKTESLKILEEAAVQKSRVEELLGDIEERLSELEKEKEEFAEFEKLDKQRRVLEYTIYELEVNKATEQLNKLEVVRNEEYSQQQLIYDELCSCEQSIQLLEEQISSVSTVIRRLNDRHAAKSQELSEKTVALSAVRDKLSMSEYRSRMRGAQAEGLRQELENLEQSIRLLEDQIAQLEPECQSVENVLVRSRSELASLHSQVEALYGKQGRGRQFSSKSDRDKFLNAQVVSLQKQFRTKQQALQSQSSELDRIQGELREKERLMGEMERTQSELLGRFNQLTQDILSKTVERNSALENRKSCWKSLEDVNEKLVGSKEELEKAHQRLNSCLPRHIAVGLSSVEKIAEDMKIEGYFGPLIDNFRLKNEGFRKAVEAAVGNALFHIVVDTDETAALLMKELDRLRAGRLTFLPLSRLRVEPVTYPDSPDARSLIDVAIEFDSIFEPAIRQVFGKKLLARDLDVAAQFSREFNLDVVTKDGDIVNRRGAYEGGFHDDRGSKIVAIQKLRDALKGHANLSIEQQRLSKLSDENDLTVNEVVRALHILEADRSHVRTGLNDAEHSLTQLRQHAASNRVSLQKLRDCVQSLEQDADVTSQQIEAYKAEIASPLEKRLSDDEQELLSKLAEEERQSKQAVEECLLRSLELNKSREQLVATLENNFLRRKQEISSALAREAFEGDEQAESEADQDVEALVNTERFILSEMDHLQRELEELEGQLESKKNELMKEEQDVQGMRNSEVVVRDRMNVASKMQEKLLNKRSMLVDTISKKQKLLRDLGMIPKQDLDKLKKENEKSLMKSILSVNEQLKKFPAVNKKALEQYVGFNEQREKLVSRQEQLAADSLSINQLMDGLDAQKEEAILRTFRGVSEHFREVFSELVNGGHGELVMRTSTDPDHENVLSVPVDGCVNMPVSSFVGVEVRVSFSGTGQQFEMNQLSGGQKTLVALALIFAIQRCDPAPFYLFDEIDQALDANYRASVARLIHKQAHSSESPAQFITTTFRPELVAVADKCYGIALMNKVSNIYAMSKSTAQSFVTNLMQEEAVGAVNSIPSYQSEQSAVISDESSDDEENESLEELQHQVEEIDMHEEIKKGSPGKRKQR